MQRKDKIQRVLVVLKFIKEFRPAIFSNFYKECHGICCGCGIFGHGGRDCDKALIPMSVSSKAPLMSSATEFVLEMEDLVTVTTT